MMVNGFCVAKVNDFVIETTRPLNAMARVNIRALYGGIFVWDIFTMVLFSCYHKSLKSIKPQQENCDMFEANHIHIFCK
jgi:hypothetical protein